MPHVVAIAALTVAALLAIPWGLRRAGDDVRLRQAKLWWASASIVVFASVVIAGQAWGGVPTALGAAVTLLVAAALSIHARFRGSRRLARLHAALAPGPAEPVIRALDVELARLLDAEESRGRYEAWARWSLHVAARAAETGHVEDALRWLLAIEGSRAGTAVRNATVQRASALHLDLGDRAAARALLGTVSRPARPDAMEEAFAALDALLEAIEGDHVAAMTRAERALAAQGHAAVRATWQVARAHAVAASGDHVGCRSALGALRSVHGDRVLRRIVAHRGPASDAAGAMLEPRGPYR